MQPDIRTLQFRLGTVREHIEQAIKTLQMLDANGAVPLNTSAIAQLRFTLLIQDPAAVTERDIGWLWDNSPYFHSLVSELARHRSELASRSSSP